ncbi:MAG: agmatine deiminase family protein, partial [Candidatus Wallbacteria bacterium]|nr:agmatine deiminase family protein [Candidatus Wallbacteria bacterium]
CTACSHAAVIEGFQHYGYSLFGYNIRQAETGSRPAAVYPGMFYSPLATLPVDGIVISWDWHAGIPLILKQICHIVTDDLKVWIRVDPGEVRKVESELRSYTLSINLRNVEFIEFDKNVNSLWMGDYGPIFIHTEEGDREIISLSCPYGSPGFNAEFGNLLGLKVHQTEYVEFGGNLSFDGRASVVMAHTPVDMGIYSEGEIRGFQKALFNVDTVIFQDRLKSEMTGLVDVISRTIDEKSVFVGRYDISSSCAAGNDFLLDGNVQKFAYSKFKPYRLSMPPVNAGATTYGYPMTPSHIGAIIVNEKILLPVFASLTDQAAVAMYSQRYQGCTIHQIDCRALAGYMATLTSIIRTVSHDPFELFHEPFDYEIDSRVPESLSLRTVGVNKVDTTKISLFYRVGNEGPFTESLMYIDTYAEKKGQWFKSLMQGFKPGDVINYYFRAHDCKGMYETLPEDAPDCGVFELRYSPEKDPAYY